MTEHPRLLVDTILRCTAIGQPVGDAFCEDAAAAVELAAAGRLVWTFETSAAAERQIEKQRPEVRERITISHAGCEETTRSVPGLAAIYTDRRLHGHTNPVAYLSALRGLCAPDGPIFAVVRNGVQTDAAGWAFNERTIERLLLPFGDVSVALNPGRDLLCVEIRARAHAPDHGPRIAALVRLTAEDRWVRQCLTALDAVSSYIVAFDDNAPQRTFEFVREYPSVVQASEESSPARALQLANAWAPDWILFLDSCDVLAPEAKPAILAALRSAGSRDEAFTLRTVMMWDREGTQRLDVPEQFVHAVRMTRSTGHDPISVPLPARVFNYRWFDPHVRSARRAVASALSALNIESAEPTWLSIAGPTGPVEQVTVRPAVSELLTRALERRTTAVSRALCIDALEIDAALVVKERFPAATVTGTTNAGYALHPHFAQYNAQIAGQFEDIDFDLVFGDTRFDLIIDVNPLADASTNPSRFRHVRRAVQDDGIAIFLFDESTMPLRVDDLFVARTFTDAGFSVAAVDSRTEGGGGRIVLVTAHPAVYRHPAPGALTIVVPIDDDSHLTDEFWTALRNEAASVDAAIVAVRLTRFDCPLQFDESQNGVRSIGFYEPGIDSAVRVAYGQAPAEVICLIPAGTRLRNGWCTRTIQAFEDSRLGLLSIDAGIAAISARAIDPLNWPRSYDDDLIRMAVLRGLVSRRGFTEAMLNDAIVSRPPIRRASATRLEWERARAFRTGIIGVSTIDEEQMR